jgi:hypothetical protein
VLTGNDALREQWIGERREGAEHVEAAIADAKAIPTRLPGVDAQRLCRPRAEIGRIESEMVHGIRACQVAGEDRQGSNHESIVFVDLRAIQILVSAHVGPAVSDLQLDGHRLRRRAEGGEKKKQEKRRGEGSCLHHSHLDYFNSCAIGASRWR